MAIEKPEVETFIINDESLFNRLVDFEQKIATPYLVIDTETDSVIEKTANLYGIGLAFNQYKAFYIVWRNKDGSFVFNSDQRSFITNWLYNICSNRKVIGHNLVYDILILENNLNINITDFIYSDTILQKHTIDEEPPHNLKETGVKYLGEWADKAKEALLENIKLNGGKTTKEQMDMYKADTNILSEYCCWDTILTYMLFELFEKKLQEEDLTKLFYEDEVMPLYKLVTINMKRKGFPIDVDYYKQLKVELSKEIQTIEDEIISLIKNDVADFERNLLDEEFPVKLTGNFPKYYAEVNSIPLPISGKTGEVTLAAKAVKLQLEEAIVSKAPKNHIEFYDMLLAKKFSEEVYNNRQVVQTKAYFDKYTDSRYIFNLSSNDHLIALIFDSWGFQPNERTPGGKPKIDDDFLETVKEDNPVVAKLLDYKKLNKLQSTYVEGILDRQINGIIYTSMKQFGTTSGRYSSSNPNLQNQPRTKDEDSGLSPLVLKYVNAIKKGFIAGKGYKVVNADYSSLEPVCFAHMSEDEGLRNIFRTGEDLYSRIAIDVFKLQGVSAKKKDANYLKNIHPEFRQKSKIFCLAVPYGAEESRIKDEMKCTYGEAAQTISAYLNAYPNLKRYMYKCNYEAKKNGYVKTIFGRVRHLKAAQTINVLYGDEILDYKWAKQRGLTDKRREYKNLLNNAKNFKIQGLAAHIVNRAMIQLTKKFIENNIDGWIGIQVHDEITCIVAEHQSDLAAKLLQECMEKTTQISVPLQAEPIIADNWSEAK